MADDVKITIPEQKVYPSFYSILTARVRYDKDIPMGAKVLFSEITALCNKRGYCYATNRYFAGLYDVTETTVSTWIKKLCEQEHLCSSYINGMRKMYIPQQTVHGGSVEQVGKPLTEKEQADKAVQIQAKKQADYFKKKEQEAEADPASREEIKSILSEFRLKKVSSD